LWKLVQCVCTHETHCYRPLPSVHFCWKSCVNSLSMMTHLPILPLPMEGFRIVRYTGAHREGLLKVWEESVLATHDFLTSGDFEEIRSAVHTVDFNAFD